ncbi:hypothetical protein NA57DRAFT_69440 [Rhizodiscina lignyota]|uniref:RRM domain-containing protein n=1 Tax=Rhizodiscina lignyota TaxID=1504668 RepID=A0A9P4M130_9PEZI|nr:hypothetical protein NA57DRAFT_69440 [Rhizodiscina lignyota]
MSSLAEEGVAPFPRTKEEFNDDFRVSQSMVDGKFHLEDEDGEEWVWDDAKKSWTISEPEDQKEKKAAKHKYHDEQGGKKGGKNQAKKARTDQSGPKTEAQNTAVYVTSLPLDADVDDIHNVFSKYGLVAKSIDPRTGDTTPRIKIYTDDDGKSKGEALVVYFRPESVQLAIQMLDETDFRLGEAGPMGKMQVKEADWSYKVNKDPTKMKGLDGAGGKKQMLPSWKLKEVREKMNNKLADWDDDDDMPAERGARVWTTIVVLKHMFTLEELEHDPTARKDIKADIRDECAKLGKVEGVVVWDREKAGVVTVRFESAQAAAKCVEQFNGRHFGGRTVEASFKNSRERYMMTPKKGRLEGDDEAPHAEYESEDEDEDEDED